MSKSATRDVRLSPFKLVLAISLVLAAGVLSLMAIGLAVLVGCGNMPNPEGVDSDLELTEKPDGLIYRIGEDSPYTGKAYCTVFHEHSPIFGWSLHWQGEFKDGKMHGTWILPASRRWDSGFTYGDDRGVVRVEFRDGVEVQTKN